MVLMTMIARIADGLPLAATMQEDEQTGRNLLEYQNQAKLLFRKLGPQSPTQCSIETGPFLFQDTKFKRRHGKSPISKKESNAASYLIENDICYLVLCERNFSKRLAFGFLEEIAQEFHSQYGKKVNSVTRPYPFIEFDTFVTRCRRSYVDSGSRTRRGAAGGAAGSLAPQLGDVQRIMMQNIDDVLHRGAMLSELDTKTANLSMLSQKYKKDATYLNTKSMFVKVAAGCIALLVFILYFWIL